MNIIKKIGYFVACLTRYLLAASLSPLVVAMVMVACVVFVQHIDWNLPATAIAGGFSLPTPKNGQVISTYTWISMPILLAMMITLLCSWLLNHNTSRSLISQGILLCTFTISVCALMMLDPNGEVWVLANKISLSWEQNEDSNLSKYEALLFAVIIAIHSMLSILFFFKMVILKPYNKGKQQIAQHQSTEKPLEQEIPEDKEKEDDDDYRHEPTINMEDTDKQSTAVILIDSEGIAKI